MENDRLARQLHFIREIDKLKNVLRQTWLLDRSRQENSAEHSWHLAAMATVLAEHAKQPNVDLVRVLKMIALHDVVEIDAGDTFAYDEGGNADKGEREKEAAARIFGLLPPDQERELRGLWEEFEARETPDARFGAALDRLQPLLHNYLTQGAAWQAHGVHRGQVLARNEHIAEGAPTLWTFAKFIIDDAVERGYLAPEPKAEGEAEAGESVEG